MNGDSRPVLRPVESIVVTDREKGRVLVLRDTQGITDGHAVIPEALIPVVARFTGDLTCNEIAREASVQVGVRISADVVTHLAEELESGLFLQGHAFRAARARIESDFAASSVRPASHAGGAYHGERRALERYIDETCLARADGASHRTDGASHRTDGASHRTDGASDGGSHPVGAPAPPGRMIGLVAPHIDPWRGALGYGRAYAALKAALPQEVDTFILLGTSHAPMREPFALCRKDFDTPLGRVAADTASLDALSSRARGFDPYADQFNHKREHSLEFQVVFLKHLMKERPFRIVPILSGLGAFQSSGNDPGRDPTVARFLDALRELIEARSEHTVVVAGADLAHVGPRFGDTEAYDKDSRAALGRLDGESIERATTLDAAAFWSHVVADLRVRRVCGLAPIWSLLSAIGASGAHGRVLHYEQTVDQDDGSIVSHAGIGYYV